MKNKTLKVMGLTAIGIGLTIGIVRIVSTQPIVKPAQAMQTECQNNGTMYDCTTSTTKAYLLSLAKNEGVTWHDATEVKQEAKYLTVTMYTSRPEETDSSPCIAASNVDICTLKKAGVNTCASNDYPFGTRITVEGLGTCTVLDRMNSRYTGKSHLDWYAGKDLEGALAFGSRKMSALTH